MFFPTCRPVTGDINPDSVPGLTADKFVQYLFYELLLSNKRMRTPLDADIFVRSIDPECGDPEEKAGNINPIAPQLPLSV
ncbi:hypothetical protein FJ417_31350 [Mesorhizobium sp. B3-1-7]|uniref:hypothetical protein n=1 Tax=Mesorhizobium sp. B3-1-7 TaxID=2589894 RepID=UPI001125CB1E|nr:hypothetical protein [Mesorhizobium sp. B3-1-7]TPI47856.1 hypothetical protein FJ417_31350 [Mesorhizobium sp. B3-1-7]